MKDWKAMQELEAQIARDMQRYREVERLEGELVQNIPHQGFTAVSTRGRYGDEKAVLADSIRKNREMLAGARTHRD
jgi:hypothetical protein